ncbi:hypothetical protein SARC_05581 [Sphaeroforma arctica JP610]|uniref:Uncharacterized protein n=1 Tax=Sphaeroforma arctica JP610 TaxID=667725 RepID=A0A0L0FZV3_9EUKA|nr:hypothetical protein SARC_05581 [Sphaeroforma arctica JP610]KNC82129.1 hypothetical protein SARC_05581 [Sphaeroforma arctica JP610]|eukprot:XP_014156031.1 hypothetical protein SARC_05581 [Sphaeroforma arctica JP610]
MDQQGGLLRRLSDAMAPQDGENWDPSSYDPPVNPTGLDSKDASELMRRVSDAIAPSEMFDNPST